MSHKCNSRKLSDKNSLQCQGIGIVEEYSWCKHINHSMQCLWISHSFHHFWEAPEWWRRLDRSEHPLHWKLSRTPLNLPSSLLSTSALLSLSLSAPNTDKFSLSSEWIRMIVIYTHIHYLLSSSFSATVIVIVSLLYNLLRDFFCRIQKSRILQLYSDHAYLRPFIYIHHSFIYTWDMFLFYNWF